MSPLGVIFVVLLVLGTIVWIVGSIQKAKNVDSQRINTSIGKTSTPENASHISKTPEDIRIQNCDNNASINLDISETTISTNQSYKNNEQIKPEQKERLQKLLANLSFMEHIDNFTDNEIIISPMCNSLNGTFLKKAQENNEFLFFARLSFFAGISVVNQHNDFCLNFNNNVAILLLNQIDNGVPIKCKIPAQNTKFQITIYNIDYDLLQSQLESILQKKTDEERIKSTYFDVYVDKEITAIEQGLFADHYHIKRISIAPGPIVIGKRAFAGWEDICEIYLPDTVRYIDAEAFCECPSLKMVHLSNSLEYIGAKAFFNCGNIEEIQLPNTLEKLDIAAFSYCSKLKSIYLSDGLFKLDKETFFACGELREINFPDSISIIGHRAFLNCISIERVVFSKSLQKIEAEAFKNCSKLENIHLPNTLKFIGDYAFFKCGIKNLILPSDQLFVGSYAFSYCSGLKEVSIYGTKVSAGSNCFKECANLSNLYVNGSELPSKFNLSCFQNLYISNSVKSFSNKIFVSEKLKSFKNYEYERYRITCHIEEDQEHMCLINGVIYNKEVTELISYPIQGDNVFTIPDTVVSVKEYSFACTNISQINVPASVTHFSESALCGCRYVDIVVVPDSYMDKLLKQQKERLLQYEKNAKIVRKLMKAGNVVKSENTRHGLLGRKD